MSSSGVAFPQTIIQSERLRVRRPIGVPPSETNSVTHKAQPSVFTFSNRLSSPDIILDNAPVGSAGLFDIGGDVQSLVSLFTARHS